MKEATPQEIKLVDYKSPTYTISDVDFVFELDDHHTKVSATMTIHKKDRFTENVPLELNGIKLKLVKIILDGVELGQSEYVLDEEWLTISDPGKKQFIIQIMTEIDPAGNKTLDGLYKSGSVYCTQNEPEGMRRITYFIDRPDVMAKYQTKIIANKELYPILLSNGNKVGSGELEGGLHWATWVDPFPKPSYLFALVAGDLGQINDQFTTKSGRVIDLNIYCDKGNEKRCYHSMESLKKSMKWDEDVYGLEYDLDIYMIVAVDSFNMGAMENKGLNIFNSSCALADPETATDTNFQRVQEVIGHEYFHNWTGNRVTCRDWFQLTLKEGLTVFRDQEFSSDMESRSVERIKNVKSLRASQFSEDAGPMSHPIKPSSYIEINNFYTQTVYFKGAEIIRMIHTILGPENFRKGIDKYFEYFDGQAVTTEDFVKAMEDASSKKLDIFKRWYSTAGTPIVDVDYEYDSTKKTFKLKVNQTGLTNGKELEHSLFIPLKFSLFNMEGHLVELVYQGQKSNNKYEVILENTEREQEFIFENVNEKVLPSLNRDFSAPIKINVPYSFDDLLFLMIHENDPFNRWETVQLINSKVMKELINDSKNGKELILGEEYINAFKRVLKDEDIDLSFKSLLLTLPTVSIIAEESVPFDYENAFLVRQFIKKQLSIKFEQEFLSLYNKLDLDVPYSIDQESIGRRSLKNVCLSYLNASGASQYQELTYQQYEKSINMTDTMSSLALIVEFDSPKKEEILTDFYNKWKNDSLVLDKWFAVQAGTSHLETLTNIKKLTDHESFDMTVPNRLRSVMSIFINNPIHFHNKSGEGYQFLSDIILKVDKFNPQMASFMTLGFNKWKKLDDTRKTLIKKELETLMANNLSKNTYEVVSKALS